MLLAKNNSEERIYALPGLKAKCPICSEEVIAKCGNINVWHWAHKSNSDCDSFGEPETKWHLNWKKVFPKKWQEVVIKKNGQVHRADVVTSLGRVIEFQNSPISEEKVLERESFYKNMVWVLNGETIGKGIECLTEYNWYWNRFPKSWKSTTKPIYVDLGFKILLIKYFYRNHLKIELLTKDEFLKRVVLVEVPKDE